MFGNFLTSFIVRTQFPAKHFMIFLIKRLKLRTHKMLLLFLKNIKIDTR
jgi:hypothetical protein